MAHGVYIKLKTVLEDKRMKMNTKIKVFNTLIGRLYSYNSELWTLTKTNEKRVNLCQRNYLVNVLHKESANYKQ